jgi:CP family cyanate transporter-like MFS transporter
VTIERPDAGSATLPGPAAEPSRRRGGALILAGIVLVAANLRLAVSATGALLDPLSATLRLSPAVTSFLTSVWVLAFALGGLAGSPLARRFGVDRVLGAALVALIAGSLLRGMPAQGALLAGSAVAGLGIALANVLLPAVARAYFPTRIGFVTGLYGTALTGGSAIAALVAVPAADALGGPSAGLALWAAPAVVALLAWYGARGERSAHPAAVQPGGVRAHIPLRALTRSRLAWAMAALFALQSACAYVVMGYLPSVFEGAGMSPAHAGALMSVTFFLGIPTSFVVPVLGARMRDQRALILGLSLAFLLAFIGLAVAPAALAWPSVVLMAIGMSTFQLVLALFGLRGGSPAGTAALSTFAQSLGYLAAAGVPFAAGMLHDATGSWTVPLLAMAALVVCQAAVGLYVASGRRGTVAAETEPTEG